MCRLLRLAILFASRRRDDLLPMLTLAAEDENLTLTLPQAGRRIIRWAGKWSNRCQWQSYVHWPLRLNEQ